MNDLQRLALGALTIEPERTVQVYTGRSFVAVAVDDNMIGSAMDYSLYDGSASSPLDEPNCALLTVAECLAEPVGIAGQTHLRELAIRTATINALSRPYYNDVSLTKNGLRGKVFSFERQRSWLANAGSMRILQRALGAASRVGVVGFGGLMELAAGLPGVEQVIVCDKDMAARADLARAMVTRMNSRYGYSKIVLSAKPLMDAFSDCDFVQITPSAFCNGTMCDVLTAIADRPFAVVGPSGALVPSVWFDAGATLVCVELRNTEFLAAYLSDDHLYEWYAEYQDRFYVERAASSL